MTVTEALKRFRKEKKITQKEIADHLGITQQTYQYYESKGGLSAEFIKKIADTYKVSTDYLLGVSGEYGNTPNVVAEEDLKTLAVALSQSAQALQKIMQRQYKETCK